MARSFYEIFVERIRDLFRRNPAPSQADLDQEFVIARAQAGGQASGEARRSAGAATGGSTEQADASTVAAEAAAEAEESAVALAAASAGRAHTTPLNHFHTHSDATAHQHAHVHKAGVASHGAADSHPPMTMPMDTAGGTQIYEAGAPAGTVRLAITEKPWDGSASRYASTADYCDACLINENDGPRDGWVQARCHLPVREPNGDINANAIRAAAGALAGSRGGLNVSAASKAAASKKLDALKKQAGIGEGNVAASASDAEPELAPVYAPLRLADEGGELPQWQVFHVVGDHGEHPQYGRIVFTKDDGDAIIRNHAAGVLGRSVPLDIQHTTSLHREAGGYVDEFRWGRRGEGLPGYPEPSGQGDILYAHFPNYNDVGRHALLNEHYRHQSPEYDRNYQGRYGAVALALAATNNPFLRGLRTLQGREQAPVMLTDTELSAESHEEAHTMAGSGSGSEQQQQQQGTVAATAEGAAGAVALEIRRLEQDLRLERAAREASDQRLALVETARHEDNVTAAVEKAIMAGTPPALARKVGRVLLSLRPNEQGTIRLSDDEGAKAVNVYDALLTLLEDLPRIKLGRVTAAGEDLRPENESTAKLEEEYRKLAEHHLQASGVQLSANGGGGQNGSGSGR